MSVVEIKVTLEDVEPETSRILQVPWGLPDPDFGSDDLPANKHTLWDVIEDTGRKTIHYIYDFGDNWEFTVALERIDPADGRRKKPVLLESRGKAPEQYPNWEDWNG